MAAVGLEISSARLLARPGSQEELTLQKLEQLIPHFIGSDTRAQHPDRFLVVVRLLGEWPKAGRRPNHEKMRELIQTELDMVNPSGSV